MLGGIEIANQNIGQLALFLGDQVIIVAELAHHAGVVGHGRHQFPDAFLNALGDDNFAFPGQQFHGAHLAHVHTHRVGGAPSFVFNSG